MAHLCTVVQLVQFGLDAVDGLLDFRLSCIGRVPSSGGTSSSSTQSWSVDLLLELLVQSLQGGLKIMEVFGQTLNLLLHLPHFLTISSPLNRK